MDQTIFYIFGGALIVSAALVVLLATKSKPIPGNLVPLIAVWFAILGLGAATFAVLNGVDDSAAPEESQEYAINGEAESAGEEASEEERHEENEELPEKELEQENSINGAGEVLEGETGSQAEGGEVANGAAVFTENCSTCHGGTGHGGNGGPDLRTMPLAQTEAGAIEQVTKGGGGMPAFAGQLSEEEIEDVAAYVVQEITHGE
ncbi:MAG: cytochrome [Solirubrobacterales bacterium]|nr:cytochrome [Solirubrobacterales bacterium]